MQPRFFSAVGEDYVFSIDPAIFVYTPDGGSVLSINVEIIDDKVFEGREDFSLILDSPQPRVVFNPQETSIAITDNEGLWLEYYFSSEIARKLYRMTIYHIAGNFRGV